MGTSLQNIDDIDKPQWYVVNAYKQEAKAENVLSAEDGLDFYIPKHYVLRTVRGKKQKIKQLVPYIPNLIFIHASWKEIYEFKKKYPFITFATHKTKNNTDYLIVPDKQMENFIRATSDKTEDIKFYTPDEIDFKKGAKVRVVGGEFDGVEGVFQKVTGKRNKQLVVILPGFLAASIKVNPDFLELID